VGLKMQNEIKNQQQFAYKLFQKGILISGTNSDGAVWDLDGNDISQQPEIQKLIEEHNAEIVEEPSPFK